MSCNDFPILKNGTLNIKNTPPFNINNYITFNCNEGYYCEGPNKFTCVLNKNNVPEWRSFGYCKPKTCGIPPKIENTIQIGYLYTFPNSVQYKCKENYKMIDKSNNPVSYDVKIYCSSTGNWVGQTSNIKCIPISCPKLIHPENGTVTILNNIAKYHCNRGFKLFGNDERFCLPNGTWNGNIPSCKKISCLPPGPFSNCYIRPLKNSYNYNDLISVSSQGKVELVKCLENGKWSNISLACVPLNSQINNIQPINTILPSVNNNITNIKNLNNNTHTKKYYACILFTCLTFLIIIILLFL